MYYSSQVTEREINDAERKINENREAAALIPHITKVVSQFDNKVFNCKLEKALQEQVNSLIYIGRDSYNNKLVEIRIHSNYTHKMVYLISFNLDDLKDGKRIEADKINDLLRNRREILLQDAYELEVFISKLPQVKAYIQESIDKINNYLQGLNHEVRNTFNIPYCIRTC